MDIEFEDLIITGIVLVCILLFGSMIYMAIQDQKQWDVYRITHHCIAKGTKKGQSHTGFGTDSKGNVVTTFSTDPDQTIYVCDGGEMQIR